MYDALFVAGVSDRGRCFPRVVYVFGKRLQQDTVDDVTPTYLTPRVLATLREADAIAHRTLTDTGACVRACVCVCVFGIPYPFANAYSIYPN